MGLLTNIMGSQVQMQARLVYFILTIPATLRLICDWALYDILSEDLNRSQLVKFTEFVVNSLVQNVVESVRILIAGGFRCVRIAGM